jgi:hypothetical protein
MSTVVTLPPAYSSQIGTQFEYPQPIHEGLRTSQQAASFAAGELDEILNDPAAAEEYDNKEVRHFYHPQDYNAARAPMQLPRLSQLVNIGPLTLPS